MRLNTELLRAFRKQQGLTLAEAGKLVGAVGPSWWHWEHGKYFPRKHLEAIALALKVPVGFLILEPDGKPKEA